MAPTATTVCLLAAAALVQYASALHITPARPLSTIGATHAGFTPRFAHPRCQFGGDPERKSLTRDTEPDEFFATNMDTMSDADKLKSPVVIGGVALIVLPFIVGLIALAAAQ